MCTYYKKYEDKLDTMSFPMTPCNYGSPNYPDQHLSPYMHSPSPPPSLYKPSRPLRPRPNKLYLESLGIQTPKQELEKEYLCRKCHVSKSILKENWNILLYKSSNFLKIVDKDKVAYHVTSKELSNIISSGFFSEEEKKAIKKMRYQGRNNMAAKAMREKYKAVEVKDQCELQLMKQEKIELLDEMEQLKLEIAFYKHHIN